MIMTHTRGRSARRRILFLLGWNIAAALIVLYGAEAWLRRVGAYRDLPVDGSVHGVLYTWGHVVTTNAFGFRDRPWPESKPEGTFRIVALGDSLTWGAGVADGERYTSLLEKRLNGRAPDCRVEVLNLGLSGLCTADERDLLYRYGDRLNPDLILVGFCLNDTQPREQAYSPERARVYARLGPLLSAIRGLRHVGLRCLSAQCRKGLLRGAELLGLMPDWETALARTYEPDSAEWKAFESALDDIATYARDHDLPPPIMALLNQGTWPDRPTDYRHPDDELRRYLDWYDSVEAAAASRGFITVRFDTEVADELNDRPLGVNRLDVHPSPALHALYARKLADVVAPLVAER